jgi:hypothetical protein
MMVSFIIRVMLVMLSVGSIMFGTLEGKIVTLLGVTPGTVSLVNVSLLGTITLIILK